MSLFPRPSQWRRGLVVCLLTLGTVLLVMRGMADTPPRSPLSKEQQQKLKEVNRFWGEAQKLAREAKLEEAVASTEKALALAREVFGMQREKLIPLLEYLARLQERREDWAAAVKARQEVLTLRQHQYGKDDWHVTDARLALADVEQRSKLTAEQRGQLRQAEALNQQIGRLFRSGKYREILPLAQQELSLREQVLGEQHPSYANSLNNLAGSYYELGDYAKAGPLFLKSVALHKQVLGEQHPSYAQSLNSLAGLYNKMGAYAKAEPLYRQVLALRKKLLGEQHPAYASGLNNLATLYTRMGHYAKAEPLYQQALTLRKRLLGEQHLDYAQSLNNLAALYRDMGDYAKAEPLARQALELRKKVQGEKHPDYITSLNNLATVYQNTGEYTKAEPLARQALTLYKEVLGEKNPAYAIGLNNLAELYIKQGDYTKAEPLLQQALTLNKEVLGEKNSAYTLGLNNLAQLYKERGDYAKAEPLLQQALTLNKELLGDRHPDYAINLSNLALVYLGKKEPQRGEPLARQAAEITRSQLELTAAVQSERQQLAMTANSRMYLDIYLTLAVEAQAPAEQVYAAVLAWKGSVSARQQQLHLQRQRDQRPEIAKLYNQLQNATARLAQLSHSAPNSKQPDQLHRDLEKVGDEIERLQRDLARLNEPFRQQLRQQRMNPAELRKALPKGTALVDLLEYDRHLRLTKGNGKVVRERRVIAFVLRPDKPTVQLDLGQIQVIHHAVTEWRKHYGLGKLGLAAGRQLRQFVWQPLERHLIGASTVLISPDGLLAKFPWAALPGSKRGTYLIEQRAVAVVPIPQQLPLLLQRPSTPAEASASLLLVGDVDYGADPGRAGVAVAARSTLHGNRPDKLGPWPPLAETRQEILAVRDSFEHRYAQGKVTVLRKGEATEEAVRRLAPHHRYLHFATHGFFAPESLHSRLAVASRNKQSGSPSSQPDVSGFHPGLLSGLVMAGANRGASAEGDDGILTALEVGALDLSDTELAVLSACQTGLGAEAGGEGLLGLQRAFQIAGARSVVAGLWTVDDRATRSLMVDFYDNLWSKKMSRLEALRQAQLNMLREGIKRGLDLDPDQPPDQERRLPPFYWAAFVLSGDWR